MRALAAPTLVLAGLGVGAILVACFDVLHGTGDLRTSCEIDADAPGCTPSTTGVCAPSRAEAQRRASHACAWLGACETPLGGNALGACSVAARLAFDCEANPNHPARGARAERWECLADARSCGDVHACIFPGGGRVCASPGSYTSCGRADSGAGPNDDAVRVECVDAGAAPYPPAHGENCSLWGQTCASAATRGTCAGSPAQPCASSECNGATISWCVGGVDVGIDCASFGSARCGGFPVADAATWVACIPAIDAGPGCPPDLGARCAAGVARLCPAGSPESVDCAALLGDAQGAAGCQEGPLDPPFDWTSPCSVAPPACGADACDGGAAIGCARGAAFPVDCAAMGLGPCTMQSTDLGTEQHAACSAP